MALFKTTQDLNFNCSKKIDTFPYNFITGHHIDIKYLHSFFAECYMHIPLKDRTSKLPTRRAQRYRFLAYSYTTTLVPTYVVIVVHDNNTYGGTRVSKDIIFYESSVFHKYIDNSPADAEFGKPAHRRHHTKSTCPSRAIEMNAPLIVDLAQVEQAPPGIPNSPPPLELYEPGEYLDLIADLRSQEDLPV